MKGMTFPSCLPFNWALVIITCSHDPSWHLHSNKPLGHKQRAIGPIYPNAPLVKGLVCGFKWQLTTSSIWCDHQTEMAGVTGVCCAYEDKQLLYVCTSILLQLEEEEEEKRRGGWDWEGFLLNRISPKVFQKSTASSFFKTTTTKAKHLHTSKKNQKSN